MKVLTIANRKGGAGKSTCAAHFAVEAAKSNIKKLLFKIYWSYRQFSYSDNPLSLQKYDNYIKV